MTALRGFGLTFDVASGKTRNWYAGCDGVRRWVHNDEPADTLPQIAKPDGLEVTQYRDTALQTGNTDIQVSESAYYPAAKGEKK